MKAYMSILILGPCLLGGCSTALHIRDVQSNVVYGASATITRSSLASGPTIEADATGILDIPWGLPDIETIVVYRNGYKPTVLSGNQLDQKPWVAVLVPSGKRETETENKRFRPKGKP